MVEVLHTGDTHLGYAQYNLNQRREDFRTAFRTVVDIAIDADVEAVVHGGDLFHDSRPDAQTVQAALTELRRLAEADTPLLLVVGNHEQTRSMQWADALERAGFATRLGMEPTVIGDTAFYGLDYAPRGQRDTLDYDFQPIGDDSDGDTPNSDADAEAVNHRLLVAHAMFDAVTAGRWDLGRVLAESPVAFDGILGADDHEPTTESVTAPDGRSIPVHYPGATERTAVDQRTEPQASIVRPQPDDFEIDREPLGARDFVYVDVDLDADEGRDAVVAALDNHPESFEDSVVAVTIEGDGEPIQQAPLEERLLEAGALYATVTDHREFDDAQREYQSVEFASPDDAIDERLTEVPTGELARTLEDWVRDTDTKAKSNLKEDAKAEVLAQLPETDEDDPEGAPAPDDLDLSAFFAATETGDDSPSDPSDSSPEQRQDQQQAQSQEQEQTPNADETESGDGPDDGSPGQPAEEEGVSPEQLSLDEL